MKTLQKLFVKLQRLENLITDQKNVFEKELKLIRTNNKKQLETLSNMQRKIFIEMTEIRQGVKNEAYRRR